MKARELLELTSLATRRRFCRSSARAGATRRFDNVLEFLVMAGRSPPHAVLMMIPEPWQNHEGMTEELRAFYDTTRR
jgi:glutamate synthase domain-containing protein 1